jgi:hypothetical protein
VEIKRLARAGAFDEIEARFGAKWLQRARDLVAKDAAKAAAATGGDGVGGGGGGGEGGGDGDDGEGGDMPPPPPKSAVKAPLAVAAGAETGPKGAPSAGGAGALTALASPGTSKALSFAAKASSGVAGLHGEPRSQARSRAVGAAHNNATPPAPPTPLPLPICRRRTPARTPRWTATQR